MATFKQNPKKRNRPEFKKNKNPSKNPNRIPLKSKRPNKKKSKNNEEGNEISKSKSKSKSTTPCRVVPAADLSASQQLRFFIERFESSNSVKLSSLELESLKDSCIVEQSQGLDEDLEALSKHMKRAFGKSWKEVLCEGKLVEGEVDPGNPAVLVISTSALRSLELLRSLRPLTSECRAAKLFAKHMKVEEQVSSLKSRVNIACGTPSRIKKLIEIDVLELSRLAVLVLDMHTDAKGYSLFTLPQVSGEFWDLYNSNFHQKLVKGDLHICLYGPIPCSNEEKDASEPGDDE
ncbi:hypothetical protein Sjap_005998 [Stephania japonica]|uniref:Protein CMSS1 n=1 Tax=Stephania japonica TaxID=461633 RepID=A0AAP0PLM0_9MAGN